jgi:hypothetical protein
MIRTTAAALAAVIAIGAAPQPPPRFRAIARRRSTGTGFNTLRVEDSWFLRHPDPIEFVLRGICRYDPAADLWTRVTAAQTGVATRIIAPRREAGPVSEGRLVVALPEEVALFWVEWIERSEGNRTTRNQSVRDALATSGPMLCEDIDLGPAPAGRVPACVPFLNRAEARFVPSPREACSR